MKHDEIVLRLNNRILKDLLHTHIGVKGCYSEWHWIIDLPFEEWTYKNVYELIRKKKMHPENIPETLKELKEKLEKGRERINALTFNESLNLAKTFEYPLVKGEGQYKSTKGFLDLIVHIKSRSTPTFNSWPSDSVFEFIIEIKKESDFKDMGKILRQIKEYREYYNDGAKKWESNITLERRWNEKVETYFCILSTKIPKEIKEFFEAEGIICLEIGE